MSQVFTMMLLVFGFWFGAIVLQALQRRFAPELGRWTTGWFEPESQPSEHNYSASESAESVSVRSREATADEHARVEALEARIEVLEAIVTDRGYQVSEELSD